MQLVAVEALAVLLDPARVLVGMGHAFGAPALGRVALVNGLALFILDAGGGRRHDAGVHDLPAARNVAVLLQLLAHGIEDGVCTQSTVARTLLEGSQGAGIGNVQHPIERAEAIDAHRSST